ncbi:TetR/AcrR family transcriptional regulator [Nocardia tengchongensis]
MSLREVMAVERHPLFLLASSGKGAGMRRDTRRNRNRLLAAASDLVRDGDDLTMHKVAERADMAVATAYRHFPSIDDLIAAHALAVVDDLVEYAASSEATGEELISAVLAHWIDLLQAHGHMLVVNRRSSRGFFERLHAEDPLMVRVEEAWREPVSQFMLVNGIDRSYASHATFLCNQLFDARDILDLLHENGFDQATLAGYLLATFEGALRGWSSVTPGRT